MVEEQSVETQLAVMNQMWEDHTQQDMTQFQLLSQQITDLDGKVDNLLLREARAAGATAATRRLAGYVSALVSLVISGAALLMRALVG